MILVVLGCSTESVSGAYRWYQNHRDVEMSKLTNESRPEIAQGLENSEGNTASPRCYSPTQSKVSPRPVSLESAVTRDTNVGLIES